MTFQVFRQPVCLAFEYKKSVSAKSVGDSGNMSKYSKQQIMFFAKNNQKQCIKPQPENGVPYSDKKITYPDAACVISSNDFTYFILITFEHLSPSDSIFFDFFNKKRKPCQIFPQRDNKFEKSVLLAEDGTQQQWVQYTQRQISHVAD